MGTIAQALVREAAPGAIQDLPKAGTALEHPWVFDATAHDLKAMAERGEIEILAEDRALIDNQWLIDRLQFVKVERRHG
jgi:hypothetical protein